jgi:hypothetical protein
LIETDGPSPRFTLGGSDPPRERGNPDADAAELALRTAAGLRRGVERLLVQETDRRRGPVGRPGTGTSFPVPSLRQPKPR